MKISSEILARRSLFAPSSSRSFFSTSSVIHPSRLPKVQPIIESAYKHIPDSNRFLLAQLKDEWSKTQPLRGKTALLNGHMTSITMAVADAALAAGANLELATSPGLAAHEDTINPIMASGIPYYPNADIPKEKRQGYFDFCWDCGGDLKNIVTPKKGGGMVELTHIDPAVHHDSPYPVITVDN